MIVGDEYKNRCAWVEVAMGHAHNRIIPSSQFDLPSWRTLLTMSTASADRLIPGQKRKVGDAPERNRTMDWKGSKRSVSGLSSIHPNVTINLCWENVSAHSTVNREGTTYGMTKSAIC